MSLSSNSLWNLKVKPTIRQLETKVFNQFPCGNTQIKVSYGLKFQWFRQLNGVSLVNCLFLQQNYNSSQHYDSWFVSCFVSSPSLRSPLTPQKTLPAEFRLSSTRRPGLWNWTNCSGKTIFFSAYFPIRHGFIGDWNVMEKFWERAFCAVILKIIPLSSLILRWIRPRTENTQLKWFLNR